MGDKLLIGTSEIQWIFFFKDSLITVMGKNMVSMVTCIVLYVVITVHLGSPQSALTHRISGNFELGTQSLNSAQFYDQLRLVSHLN